MSSQADAPVQQRYSLSAVSGNSSGPAYSPSLFLLCALIFWTGISAILGMLIPVDAIFFTIVTYAPTIHFAAQLIVRRSSATLLESGGGDLSDTLKKSRRAKLLTISWVLNAAIHIGVWYTSRRDSWAEVLLLPTIPGSQAILMMVFIVARYAVDIHMTKREQSLAISRVDEEAASIEITATLVQPVEPTTLSDIAPPQQDEPTAAITAAPTVLFYQPSLLLLVISTASSLFTAVLAFQDYNSGKNTILPITLIQSSIPAILLYSYLIIRILRGDQETMTRATTIAGLSYDLIPLWLGAGFLMIITQYSNFGGLHMSPIRLVPGCMEALLAVYFAVRFTRSVYAERRRRIGMGILEDHSAEPTDTREEPTAQPSDVPVELSSFYQPSLIILALSVGLSIACAIIESLAEPICGVPMSAIVYVPTIFIHLHLIYQQLQRRRSLNTTTTIQKFNESIERSMQLCFIWVLTQVFYVFWWPVSQYMNPKVMNPWVRWPEVVLMVYIVARYVRDRHVRHSGSIRLPPDPEEGDSPAVEPSSADTPQ